MTVLPESRHDRQHKHRSTGKSPPSAATVTRRRVAAAQSLNLGDLKHGPLNRPTGHLRPGLVKSAGSLRTRLQPAAALEPRAPRTRTRTASRLLVLPMHARRSLVQW
ncbi:hypothetical protein NPIL_411361 [Nephila pilipes]|uniref:Uncharacterized protein n=1 Tax=Nephila pilipes TaxID=299642 RepID=A0A8X6MGE6_NEPPI|nr:hypothetical protein NPIL_411361 [Nephila pilipes]